MLSILDVVYTTKQAETAIIFQICALAEVGNIKNNLIAVSNSSWVSYILWGK